MKEKTYYEKNKDKYKKYYKDNRKLILEKASIYQKNNPEKARANAKKWALRNKDKVRKRNKEYYLKNREKRLKQIKEQQKKTNYKCDKTPKRRIKNRIRARARFINIPKNKICEICLKNKAIDRHHEDYNKPLEVMFLCKECHLKEHLKGGK